MSLVSKPAPPPKKALSALLPRKTAPVRRKPPPPRSASHENNRVPPPPQKASVKRRIQDIPKPNSISALLPPPPERKSRSPERERQGTIQPPAELPETQAPPPTRPRNKVSRAIALDTTRNRHSTSVLPPDLAGMSMPPSSIPSLTERAKNFSEPPNYASKALDLESPDGKDKRSSTIVPGDINVPGPPPSLKTSFSNSPVAKMKASSTRSDSDILMDKMMNFEMADDFDIYGSDPSLGLPGSASFREGDAEALDEGSGYSFSREQTAESRQSDSDLPTVLANSESKASFRSYSPPPPGLSKSDEPKEVDLIRATTAPPLQANSSDALPYIPRSASMDGLKTSLRKEFSKRKNHDYNVQFAHIDEFIGDEDSDDLGDIPDLPGLPPSSDNIPSPVTSLPPMEGSPGGPPGGPPVGSPTGSLPFKLPPKVKSFPPEDSMAGGPPLGRPPSGGGLPMSLPPKPSSKPLPSFLPPKPKKDDKPAESKEAGSVGLKIGIEPPNPAGPPGGAPPLNLKNLPPKISKESTKSPIQIESKTDMMDGDVKIDNKYLFLGSPRLSSSSSGRTQREIRRMSDNDMGLAAMAGGAQSKTKVAKGFFESKANELKQSSTPRKKKKLSRVESKDKVIPIGTKRGMYIRAESGWVQVNSKEGREVIAELDGIATALGDQPSIPTRASRVQSISLKQVKEKGAVSSAKSVFESKRKSATPKTQRPKKKKSGYVRNKSGKWVAPGEKLDDI